MPERDIEKLIPARRQFGRSVLPGLSVETGWRYRKPQVRSARSFSIRGTHGVDRRVAEALGVDPERLNQHVCFGSNAEDPSMSAARLLHTT
jgi:hypothetical protein